MPGRTEFGRRLQPAALGGALVLGLAAMPAGAAEKDLTDKGKVLVEQNARAATPSARTARARIPRRRRSARCRAATRSRILPNCLPRALSGLIPTCRSLCSAPPMSKRSSSISTRSRTQPSLRPPNPKSRIKRRRHPPVTSANRVPPRLRRVEMLDVAAHERRDEARPEMMRVGICDDGRRLKSRKWRRLNLMSCQKASASTPSSLDRPCCRLARVRRSRARR